MRRIFGNLSPGSSVARRTGVVGMLATTKARRGEKRALILGAKELLEMRERFGFQDFFTGVTPGNAASDAVCRKMGLKLDGTSVVTVVDPKAMPGGKPTESRLFDPAFQIV